MKIFDISLMSGLGGQASEESRRAADTLKKVKKMLVEYFDICSVLMSKFGYEEVLSGIIKKFREMDQKVKMGDLRPKGNFADFGNYRSLRNSLELANFEDKLTSEKGLETGRFKFVGLSEHKENQERNVNLGQFGEIRRDNDLSLNENLTEKKFSGFFEKKLKSQRKSVRMNEAVPASFLKFGGEHLIDDLPLKSSKNFSRNSTNFDSIAGQTPLQELSRFDNQSHTSIYEFDFSPEH